MIQAFLVAVLLDDRKLFFRSQLFEQALLVVQVYDLIGVKLIHHIGASSENYARFEEEAVGSLPDDGGAPILIEHEAIVEHGFGEVFLVLLSWLLLLLHLILRQFVG